METIDSIDVKITADTSDFTSEIKKAGDAAQDFGRSAESSAANIQPITSVLNEIKTSLAQMNNVLRDTKTGVFQASGALVGINTSAAEAVNALWGISDAFDMVRQNSMAGYDASAALEGLSNAAETAVPTVNELVGKIEGVSTGFNAIEEELESTSQTFEESAEGAEGLADETENLSDQTSQLTKKVSDLEKKLKSAKKSAADNEKEIQNLRQEYESLKKTTSTGDLFAGLKKGLTTLGIAKFFKETITSAGELEQATRASLGTFGEYAVTVQEMANSAAYSMGLAANDYLSVSSKIGTTLQKMGFSAEKSVNMTTAAMQRAADVAATMTEVSTEDALTAISNLASGNFKTLRKLGVVINDNTLKSYAQEKGLGNLETTQQKVNAALQMFMDKTADSAGNYAKESETYAGSLETLKAEFKNFMSEAGTTLIPTVTSGIKFLQGALQDVTPYVTAVGTGIGMIGNMIAQLPEPLTKTVVGVTAASIAFNKLNKVLGATGSKLLLIVTLASFVFGKLKEAADQNNEIVSDASENAAEGIGVATDAQNDLTDSIKETGKALNALAGFDEITKLSGNKSGLSLVSDSDFQDVEEYSAALADVKSSFGELDASAAIVFDNISKYWNDVWNLVTSGDWEGVFTKLGEGVDGVLTDIFGKGWITVRDYWSKIIGMAESGDVEGAVAMVLGDIDTSMTGFFGDAWTNFKNFLGDHETELVIFGESFTKSVENFFGGIDKIFGTHFADWYKEFNTFWRSVGANLYEVTHAGEIEERKLNEKYDYTAFDLKETALDYLKQGKSVDEARELSIAEHLTTSEAMYWYQNVNREDILSDTNLERWQNSLINSGQLSDPLTEEGAYTAFAAANASNNSVTEIRTTVEMDGDKIGESVTRYQNGVAYQQNGR